MPVDQSAKVTYCWRVSYPFPSNGQPYSKTTDGTTAPNADYHREHGWPVPKSGLYHPSEADDTKNSPQADKQAHDQNPNVRQLFLPIPFGRKPFSVVPPLRNIAFYACWIVESDL